MDAPPLPRVVGLLATQNRPALAHRAAHLFFEQDYEGPKTLVVFDDGEQYFDTCDALTAVDVVYHSRVSLPTKRNQMVRHVGDQDAIYFVWDDDDYHGPTRVRRQVDALEAQREAQACVLRPTTFFDQVKNEAWTCPINADATLAFRWKFWEHRVWDESIDPGSGFRMINGRSSKNLINIDGADDYIIVWHGNHRFQVPSNANDPSWPAASIDVNVIHERLAPRICAED